MVKFIVVVAVFLFPTITLADYIREYDDIFAVVVEPAQAPVEPSELVFDHGEMRNERSGPKLKPFQHYKRTYDDPSRRLLIRSVQDELNAEATVEELDVLGVAHIHYVRYQLQDYPEGYGERFMVVAGPFDNLQQLSNSEDILARNGFIYITERPDLVQ